MSKKSPIIIALFSKITFDVKNDKKGNTSDEVAEQQKEEKGISNKPNPQYPQYINLRDLYQRFLTEWKNRIERSFSILVLSFVLNLAINFLYLFLYAVLTDFNQDLISTYSIAICIAVIITAFIITIIEIIAYKKYKKLNESFRIIEKEIIVESSKIECLNEDTAYQTLKNKCINTPQSLKKEYDYIIIIAFGIIVNLSIIIMLLLK